MAKLHYVALKDIIIGPHVHDRPWQKYKVNKNDVAGMYEALVKDIKERGLLVPLKLSPDLVLLDGFSRLEALKDAGYSVCYCAIDKAGYALVDQVQALIGQCYWFPENYAKARRLAFEGIL